MHSMHRELEIKYKRLLSDISTAEVIIEKHESTIKVQGLQNLKLKTLSEEQESQIKMLNERRDALEREVMLKAKIVMESDEKLKRIIDEIDMKVYSINEQTKVIND